MGIILDPKHGVNPMLVNCYLCGEAKEIALLGRMKSSVREGLEKAVGRSLSDGAAPFEGVVIDFEPCDKCKEYMQQGIILISVRAAKNEEERKNPYRTGGWIVVKEEAISRMGFPAEMRDQLLRTRSGFLEDEAWDLLGFPRGGQNSDQ